MIYSSKQNSKIKEISSLKEKKYRKKLGLYIAEGIKMVNEAIAFKTQIVKIVSTEENLDKILKTDAEILVVTKEVFEYLSEEVTPQGVLAVIKISSQKPKPPVNNCVLLDGVKDPGNMGTIIRTCVALGYKDLYLKDSVDPYSSKCVRASMSGIYSINIYDGSLEEILTAIKGYTLIVGDMDGVDLKTYSPPENFCIVVGNEANGISQEVLDITSNKVAIKMDEKSESLNVAIALSIIMYQLKK